jgi:SulP family sulfate permease
MDRVPYIDQSGLYTLEDIIFDLRTQNIEVVLVGLKEQPNDMLKAIDIIPDLVPEEDLFDNIEDSFAYLRKKFNKI